MLRKKTITPIKLLHIILIVHLSACVVITPSVHTYYQLNFQNKNVNIIYYLL
jgi:hypothetical protein